MAFLEETIDATLDANGELHLAHPPQLPSGPVRVTIRIAGTPQRRGLADVVREIAAEQRVRGFPGRSAEEIQAEELARQEEDIEREHELEETRRNDVPGGK